MSRSLDSAGAAGPRGRGPRRRASTKDVLVFVSTIAGLLTAVAAGSLVSSVSVGPVLDLLLVLGSGVLAAALAPAGLVLALRRGYDWYTGGDRSGSAGDAVRCTDTGTTVTTCGDRCITEPAEASVE